MNPRGFVAFPGVHSDVIMSEWGRDRNLMWPEMFQFQSKIWLLFNLDKEEWRGASMSHVWSDNQRFHREAASSITVLQWRISAALASNSYKYHHSKKHCDQFPSSTSLSWPYFTCTFISCLTNLLLTVLCYKMRHVLITNIMWTKCQISPTSGLLT